jgi:hypothetical protein
MGVTKIRNRLSVTGSIQSQLGRNDILIADVQLTDAQIRDLTAHPVEIVPAPGVGLTIAPLFVYLLLDATAGDYSDGGDMRLEYETALDTSVVVLGGGAATTQMVVTSMTPVTEFIDLTDDVSNQGLAIHIATDLTGGDPANTLSIRVWYSIVPAVPFGLSS